MLYQQAIDFPVYNKCPKSVFAAIVVSFLINNQGIEHDQLSKAIIDEWKILYDQGLVNEKPSAKLIKKYLK